MTTQEKIKALLSKTGIPAKEIKVFGSQIIVTCMSRDAASKFADVLAKFARVRGIVESIRDNKVNTNTTLRPDHHKVWIVGAVI